MTDRDEVRANWRYLPLMTVLAAACGGIISDRLLSLPLPVWVVAGAACVAAWWVAHRRGRQLLASVLVLLATASAAGAWHHARWNLYAADNLGNYAAPAPQPVVIEAVALKGPRRVAPPPFNPMRIVPVGQRTRLLVRASAIRNGHQWQAASGQATLTVDGQLLGIHAGDRVRVFGSLSRPTGATNPGGFDQAAYLRGHRQLFRLWASHPDCITVVEPARWRGVRWWIDRARTSARRTLWQNLAPQRAELASAVLLGARSEVDPEETNTFVETGTVHLLAISGLHVGIVAAAFVGLLRLLPISQTTVFWAVVLLTVAYTLLTDARPPAIRATILVAMVCAARAMRRPASPWNTLAAAGLIVLALNPSDLFSTGVHLSFLAVATLMWIAPRWFTGHTEADPLDRLIEQSRPWWQRRLRLLAAKFGRLAFACLAVWLVTAPLVASRFHVISFGAILLNVVLWIPITVALVAGFALVLSAWFLPPLVPACAWICDGSLAVLQAVIHGAHKIPGNHIWLAGLPDGWLLGFYVLLATLAALAAGGCRSSRIFRWTLAAVAVWLTVGLVTMQRAHPAERLVCTIMSVGHGSAVILEMPGGPVMICDAGKMASPTGSARTIAAYLWHKKISRIDGIVLSHADADHFNAIPELLERFAVDAIYATPGIFDDGGRSVQELEGALDRHRVPQIDTLAGQRFRVGDAVVEVLHPPEGSLGGHDNAASIVLAVEYDGRRIILPGDVDASGLERLLATQPRRCDVLMAPHHGSWHSDPEGLAAWCRPSWVVVSGRRDPRGQPLVDTYQAAGAQVVYTGDVGAVTLTIEHGEIHVETCLE